LIIILLVQSHDYFMRYQTSQFWNQNSNGMGSVTYQQLTGNTTTSNNLMHSNDHIKKPNAFQ